MFLKYVPHLVIDGVNCDRLYRRCELSLCSDIICFVSKVYFEYVIHPLIFQTLALLKVRL
jgi:hypothetical protein